MQGTISVGIDATDLFDRYEEEYEDMVGGGVPHLEINKMHISQSIEVVFGLRALLMFVGWLMRRLKVTSPAGVTAGSSHH